jgi:pSer/pThr/pTyr-binding forkhead associated (FHA) protein
MPILTLKFKKDSKEISKYKVERGLTLTIGRMTDNDIVIENLAVSGHHAKIGWESKGFLLTDLQSKNGTFVNEELIKSAHWLRHGDVITIGKHIIVFAYAPGEQTVEFAEDNINETMMMETGDYRKMLEKNIVRPQVQVEKEPMGVLSFLAGGEGEVELSKKLTRIGKNASSDIVLSGLTMGQTAATISKRPDGYSISYVGGLSKPKVNGETVKDSLKLKEFDVIEIGSVKMQFTLKA